MAGLAGNPLKGGNPANPAIIQIYFQGIREVWYWMDVFIGSRVYRGRLTGRLAGMSI